MKRQTGFYWVYFFGDLIVSYWDSEKNRWRIPGYEEQMVDFEMGMVIGKRLKPLNWRRKTLQKQK